MAELRRQRVRIHIQVQGAKDTSGSGTQGPDVHPPPGPPFATGQNTLVFTLKRINASPLGLLLPLGIILLAVVTWFPLFRIVLFSFQRFNLRNPASWVGLENYARLIDDPLWWIAARNTGTMIVGSRSSPPKLIDGELCK